MKEFYESFAFCPRCGGQYSGKNFDATAVVFVCELCGYEFYQHSVLAATAVVPSLDDPTRIMLITRRTPPYGGLLALPGGILRYGEDPAEAAVRETMEETTVAATPDRLLCSTRIDYPYRGTWIAILELAYLMRPIAIDVSSVSTPEASRVQFVNVHEVLRASDTLAFPEQAAVLAAYGGIHALSVH